MTLIRIAALLSALMVATALAGMAARPAPQQRPAGAAPKYLLEDTVPRQFGSWRELPDSAAAVVNPQTQALLDKLYSQVLTRTYVNDAGERIMLSLAYGDDQRGSLQAHKPEVCYPAQGFTVQRNVEGAVPTPWGAIAARRLATHHGARHEPVTYWFTAGDTVVRNKIELRMVQIKLGLTGEIPDGLLFRVSSIDASPERAYKVHDAFVADLLRAVPALDRKRLSGLDAVASPG